MVRQIRRRVLTIPAALAATALATIAAPATVAGAAVLDLVRGPRRRWRRLRVVGVVTALLALETTGLARIAGSWLRSGAGRRIREPAATDRNHGLERWWTGSIRAILARFGGLELRVEGAELLLPGPIIALGRHTSHADAALPAWLLACDGGYRLRYVLKKELRFAPCLDIVGHWLPNHFVDRDPEDPGAEPAALRDLVRGLGGDEAAVIFPEGTFPTAARRQRVRAKLTEQDPARAARLSGLRTLLPPRPGGTLALLDGAPDADVVLIAHVGFERLSTIGDMLRHLPFESPVDVRIWRIPRRDVPPGDEERIRWLDEQWCRLDDWVTERLSTRVTPERSAATERRGAAA